MAFQGNSFDPEGNPRFSNEYGVAAGIPVAGESPAVRAAFLNKVYLSLCGGVTFAMLCGFMAVGTPLVNGFLHMGGMGFLLMFGLLMGMTFLVQAVALKPGLNVLAYGAFTAVTGVLILSPMFTIAAAMTGGFQVVWNAFFLSSIVFGGLTGYVLLTGKNFSFMGGVLTTGLFVLLAFIVGSFFFQSTALQLGVTCGGLLLFCLFVLYDTSVIMHQLTSDMWITGALRMFLDFINIFVRVLSLLLQFNRR